MNVRLLALLVPVGKAAVRDPNTLRASIPVDSKGVDCDNWATALIVYVSGKEGV